MVSQDILIREGFAWKGEGIGFRQTATTFKSIDNTEIMIHSTPVPANTNAPEPNFTKNKSPTAIIFRSVIMFYSREFLYVTVGF